MLTVIYLATVEVVTIGVTTLGVGLPESYCTDPDAHLCYIRNLPKASTLLCFFVIHNFIFHVLYCDFLSLVEATFNWKMAVFWVVAPCSLVEVYQSFRGPCCLHHQGDNLLHKLSW
jgi:hypothetical protein